MGIGCRGIRSPTFTFRRARIRAAALADPAPEDNPVGRPRAPTTCRFLKTFLGQSCFWAIQWPINHQRLYIGPFAILLQWGGFFGKKVNGIISRLILDIGLKQAVEDS
jgi:hypothetical protein